MFISRYKKNSELEDFNNRQYDPQIGRFLSVDSLAPSTDAFSPYVAMNNDPASLTDPDGLRVGDHREMAWSNRNNQYFWDAYLIDAQEYLNTNHIAQFIATTGWGEGGSVGLTTYYEDEAQGLFAQLTGQTLAAPSTKEGIVTFGDFVPGTYEDYLKYEADQAYSVAVMATNLPKGKGAETEATRNGEAALNSMTDMIVDFTPFFGTLNMLSITIRGKSLLGYEYHGKERALAAVPILAKVKFTRGVSKIATVEEQAAELSQKIGRNSVTIKTVDGHIRYDLLGRSHGKVPTPHSLKYTRHIGPNGMMNFTNPKFPNYMTQQEIRIIKNYLKSIR